MRRRPYSVILFDEIEKAHPDVFNILLQVLDDGRITDSQGRTVDFKNTIIILTSNLGSQYLLDGIGADGEITNEAKEQVQTLLHRTFRPEYLNRLDEIVFYKPLSKENITGIIDLQIAALNRRLADKQLRCELTQAAKQFIIDAAYDPQFGARPLRRYVQHTVETLLAKKILEGSVQPGSTITVDTETASWCFAECKAIANARNAKCVPGILHPQGRLFFCFLFLLRAVKQPFNQITALKQRLKDGARRAVDRRVCAKARLDKARAQLLLVYRDVDIGHPLLQIPHELLRQNAASCPSTTSGTFTRFK